VKKEEAGNKISNKIKDFEQIALEKKSRTEKLDELINLLEESDFDSDELAEYSKKLNKILDEKALFKKFKNVDTDGNKSRKELIKDFEFLLNTNEFDSDNAISVYKSQRFSNFIKRITGILFMITGLTMIITPVSKSIDMFTVFHFSTLKDFGVNTDSLGLSGHGITFMDLISLLIILSGVYIIICVKRKSII